MDLACVNVSGSTNWKSFGQVKSENIGQGDKPDYFTSKGTVIFLRKENCMYMVSNLSDDPIIFTQISVFNTIGVDSHKMPQNSDAPFCI